VVLRQRFSGNGSWATVLAGSPMWAAIRDSDIEVTPFRHAGLMQVISIPKAGC
jgi:hypothetical protein